MIDTTNEYAILQAENRALAQELARYKTIVEHLSQGVYVYHLEDRSDDHTLRLIAANNAAASQVGVESSKLIGKTIDTIFPDARAQDIPQAFADVVRTAIALDNESVYGDAQVVASAWHVHGIALPNDEIAVYFDNITQRKQTENALQQLNTVLEQRIAERTQELSEQQALLKTLFDTLPVAVSVKTADDGRFILWNPTSEAYFGTSAADIIGKTDFDLVPREQAAGFQKMDQAIFARHNIDVMPEEIINMAYGERRVLQTTKVPIYDSENQPLYMLVISSDITEQKKAAEARATLQAEVIAAQQLYLHELSTPLIPLSEQILLLPLVGSIDSYRAQQMMQTLLEGVAARHSRLVILDITGVRIVDTQVANAFVRAAQAIRLLGAEVMMTGIGPEVAQTLVQLGVDLQGIRTRGSLQTAIREALRVGM